MRFITTYLSLPVRVVPEKGVWSACGACDGKTDFYGSPHVPLSDSSIDGAVVQQRGLQSLIFISLFHLIMASGVGEEEKKVDSIANI